MKSTTKYCHICNKSILLANYTIHQAKCEKNIKFIKCAKCNKEISAALYQIHVRSCKPVYRPHRYSHKQAIKKQQVKVEPLQKDQLSKNNQSIINQTFACVRCGYLMTVIDLQQHNLLCQQEMVSCEYCTKQFRKNQLQEHLTICESLKEVQKLHSLYFSQLIKQQQIQTKTEKIEQPIQQTKYQQQLVNEQQNMEQLVRRLQLQQTNPPQKFSRPQLNRLKIVIHKKVKEESPCSICYRQFRNAEKIIQLKCKHQYHQECIHKWFKSSVKCPVCKKDARIN